LFVLAAASGLVGGDLQSWNEIRYQFAQRGRVSLSVRGGLRLRDSLSDLYDRRVGSDAVIRVGNRLNVLLGYLYRDRDLAETLRYQEHRPTAGISYLLVTRRSLLVEGTTLYDRQILNHGLPDNHRWRQQFEVEQPRRGASPSLTEALMFNERDGFYQSRSRAGIRIRLDERGDTLWVGYQFETIEAVGAWTPRHSIVTQILLH